MNRTLLYLIASTASTLASTTSCRVCSRETDVLAGPCDASAPEVEAISRAGVFWGEGDRVRRRLAVALTLSPAELEHVARHGLSRFGCEGQ